MISSVYSGKIRVRASGVLIEEESILLVQLFSPVSKQLIWTLPGGGVEFGESLRETVKREFKEETGLIVSVHDLVFVNELLEKPFHALEFFFRVKRVSGDIELGVDPEHNPNDQLLKKVEFVEKKELPFLKVRPVFFETRFWEESFNCLDDQTSFKDEEG